MATVPNPLRNEHLITLGDYQVICRMNFDSIAKIENSVGPIIKIIANANSCDIAMTDMVLIIEQSAIEPIDRDELLEAIQEVGVIVLFDQVCNLLLSTYAGVPKQKPDEKKSPRARTKKASQ